MIATWVRSFREILRRRLITALGFELRDLTRLKVKNNKTYNPQKKTRQNAKKRQKFMEYSNNTHNTEPKDPREGFRSSLLLAFMAVVFLAIIALTATGCKTCQPIIETRDSIRVEFRLDSVYVYQHDSIFRDRWRKGDTIFVTLEKWQTRYKDKIVQVHDTIRTNETQTIEVKHVPAYYKNTSAGFWVLLALLLVVIAFKVYKLYIKIKTGGLIR